MCNKFFAKGNSLIIKTISNKPKVNEQIYEIFFKVNVLELSKCVSAPPLGNN